jgi:hypothetical protein
MFRRYNIVDGRDKALAMQALERKRAVDKLGREKEALAADQLEHSFEHSRPSDCKSKLSAKNEWTN